MNATVTSSYEGYQNIHERRVKAGEREMMVLASMENGKIEFCYYNVKKWEYPFHDDVFTEEDRARLTAEIVKFYTAQGWQMDIDRRRFCPRCFEKLNGAERDDWLGCVCDFCGKQIDRFGKIASN